MKKLVLAFGALGILFALPASAAIDFQVQNVSQDNSNAVRVGANPGDVIRYEVSISGEEPEGMMRDVDLSEVLNSSTMVNAGGGTLVGDLLLQYPEEFCSTCDNQVFSFFVRVNPECVNGDVLEAEVEGELSRVRLNCDELAESGPAPLAFAVLAMIVILASVMFSNRKPC